LVIDTEFVVSFEVLPDERLIVCSMLTQPESEYAIRIHRSGWPREPADGTTEVVAVPADSYLGEVVTIGNEVIAFGRLIQRHRPTEAKQAHRLKGGRFHPVPELPEVQTFDEGESGSQVTENGKVTLADGTEVLIWDGDGYELQRNRFVRTWELAAKDNFIDWTAVAWGEGFFYLSGRKVMYARRGNEPVPVMSDAENVMFLSPGPEDSVIASHGKNRKALGARVWFPSDGSYIPVTRKDLGIAPHFNPDELYWSAATNHLYSKYGGLLTFPDSDLLALNRVRPRSSGYKLGP
jgi:hypothetical protein